MKKINLKKELIVLLIASAIFMTGLGIGRFYSYAATAGADGVVTSEATRALEETKAAEPEEEQTVVSEARLPVRPGPGSTSTVTAAAEPESTAETAATAQETAPAAQETSATAQPSAALSRRAMGS